MTASSSTAPRSTRRWAVITALALAGSLAVPAGALDEHCEPAEPEPGYRMLFDGTADSLEGWHQAGPGSFDLVDCVLESSGGMGLLWYEAEAFERYTLRADWQVMRYQDNSGIFVGFPPAGDDPWVAVEEGYEVQIDNKPLWNHDQYTGSIYDIQGPDMQAVLLAVEPLDWNTYEITVDDSTITIALNGVVVNEFTSTDPARDLSIGHFGLQNHGTQDVVRFRNIQVAELEGDGAPPDGGADLAAYRNNVGIAYTPLSNADFDGVGYSYSALALLDAGVEPGGPVEVDGFTYTWPDTSSGVVDNVAAHGQTIPVEAPAGATRLGLLAAADHGPSTATFRLDYTAPDGTPESVEVPVTVSDWTLGGGTADPHASNTVAIETDFRMMTSTVPDTHGPYVFSVSVPLDPTMRLDSIRLPIAYAGRIHLFDLAVD